MIRAPIACPAAMNHATVTSDGKMMAAVGDSTEVYLFVNESGQWKRHAEFNVANDASFSSVFSPSQRMLAIGSQDVSHISPDLRWGLILFRVAVACLTFACYRAA